MLSLISAEFTKLKYPPIYWLVGFVVSIMSALIFASHYFDVNNTARINVDPWMKLMTASNSILAVFISVPFLVLFISAAVFIEHHSNIWKQQYVSPFSRSKIYYSKLLTLLLCILITFGLIIIMTTLCGYFLNMILPEVEFAFYSPPIGKWIQTSIRVFISLLGIIGIQYFLSLRFKGFLIPASIGIVFFVVGVIVGSMNNPISKFFPYSYPMIFRDHKMFTIDKVNIVDYGMFNSVELSSVVCFVLFVILGNIFELRRVVD